MLDMGHVPKKRLTHLNADDQGFLNECTNYFMNITLRIKGFDDFWQINNFWLQETPLHTDKLNNLHFGHEDEDFVRRITTLQL